MAYPKITVNTGKALAVIASDTIPIPSPNAVQLTGTISAATANKLVAVGSDFSNVVVGDIVYNTTDNTVATVTAIDSSTNTINFRRYIYITRRLYCISSWASL